MRSINIVSNIGDSVMLEMEARCRQCYRAGSLAEMRKVLVVMPTPETREAVTLDLIGHSATAAKLLQLGESTIDMCDRQVETFFRELVRDRILPRLGVVQLRLLGCHTAVEPGGLHTLRRLAATLRMPVFGTTKALFKSHYIASGFNPCFVHTLVEAAAIPSANERMLAARRQWLQASESREPAVICA